MKRHPYITPPRHLQPSRVVDAPEPGFFRMRLEKDKAPVAARIRHEPSRDPETNEPLDRTWWWSAEIRGTPAGQSSPSPTYWVERIWTSGERISEAEYFLLLDAEYEPDSPQAQESVDLRRRSPLF